MTAATTWSATSGSWERISATAVRTAGRSVLRDGGFAARNSYL